MSEIIPEVTPIEVELGDFQLFNGTKNHNELLNRDLPNQHPIESITGLNDALDRILDFSEEDEDGNSYYRKIVLSKNNGIYITSDYNGSGGEGDEAHSSIRVLDGGVEILGATTIKWQVGEEQHNISIDANGVQVDGKELVDKTNADIDNSLSLGRKADSVVGEFSSALGNNCEANSRNALAAGSTAKALGASAIALGYSVIAKAQQFVCGIFNKEIESTIMRFIVGIGTSVSNRKNGFAVGANGNGYFAGDIYANSNCETANNGKKIATQEYVDNSLIVVRQTEIVDPYNDVDYVPLSLTKQNIISNLAFGKMVFGNISWINENGDEIIHCGMFSDKDIDGEIRFYTSDDGYLLTDSGLQILEA